MYDLQRIGRIIADIQKYLKELESYKIKSILDLKDSKTYNAASMVLFAILNRVIDLGSEIISSEDLGAPNTYRDIMPILAKANVINETQAKNLNKLVRIRNVLAHFYDDIKEKELFETIKEIHQVEEFVKTAKKRIKFE